MLYGNDKHFLCIKCFIPTDWEPEDIVLSGRQYTVVEACCVCGMKVSYGTIVTLDINGPCCGNHAQKAVLDGTQPPPINAWPGGHSWSPAPGFKQSFRYAPKQVESNLDYFERIIAAWDAKGPGAPDGVPL